TPSLPGGRGAETSECVLVLLDALSPWGRGAGVRGLDRIIRRAECHSPGNVAHCPGPAPGFGDSEPSQTLATVQFPDCFWRTMSYVATADGSSKTTRARARDWSGERVKWLTSTETWGVARAEGFAAAVPRAWALWPAARPGVCEAASGGGSSAGIK